MDQKFFAAWLVALVVWMTGSVAAHGVLLGADHGKLPNRFSPESDAQKDFPLMILAHVILAGAFVWIHRQGFEDEAAVAQGLRFGLAVALLTVVPTYAIDEVVQPVPGAIVAWQIVFGGILLLVLGVVAAARSKPQAARGVEARTFVKDPRRRHDSGWPLVDRRPM